MENSKNFLIFFFLVHLYYDNKIWNADDISTNGSPDQNSVGFINLHRIATLCNRAVFDSDPNNLAKDILQRKTVGDASESALIKFAEPFKNIDSYRSANPKIFEIPFNSVNKWQLSVHELENSSTLLMIKGAPERIIARCDKISLDGKIVPLTDEHSQAFQHAYEVLAGHGERVLGFAQVELDSKIYNKSYHFDADSKNFPTEGLVFTGLIALMDPPRPNVPEAVAKCKEAGVRVIMVTGDHPLTAQAIAKQVGILEDATPEEMAQKEGVRIEDFDKVNY